MTISVAPAAPEVSIFFYGSFIAPEVLAEVGYRPRVMHVARLDGFDIVARPLATLTRSHDTTAWGILTFATHAELDRLYNRDWVRSYRPEAVVVTTLDGAMHAALCYIAPGPTADRPTSNYLSRIIDAARAHRFPDSYVQRLKALQ